MGMLRPIQDRILIEAIPRPDKTSGGIIIPDIAKEKPVEGKVIAIGPGMLDKRGVFQPVGVKVGENVLYHKMAGTDFTLEGKEYIILRSKDVLGKITYEE